MTFADITGPTRQSGNQTIYQYCPKCGDSKWHFYLNAATGGYSCFKCGTHGYVDGAPIPPETPKEYTWEPIDPPPTIPLSEEARRYLRQRGVDHELAGHLGLRETEHEARIYVPYRDETGALVFWTARSFRGEEPKYKNLSGTKHPLWFCGIQRATPVLVEGVFDAVAIAKVGFLGVALGGKTVARHQWPALRRALDPDSMVHVCLDGDATKGAIELSDKLTLAGFTISVVMLPDGRDPAAMPPNELLRALL